MGDAEITGTALEISADVVLRCEVLQTDARIARAVSP